MATKRYQILGDIVTGAQLDEKLKDYIPAEDKAELVSWVEVKDGKLLVTMKDGRESEYAVSAAKEFENVEYDTSSGYLHFYDKEGNDAYDPVFIGGGGGGSVSGSVVKLTNQNGTTALIGAYGKAINLMFTFSSLEDGVETGSGTCKITVNGATKYTNSIAQGASTIDVSPYLNDGSNTVRVTCTDVYGVSKSLTYTITVIRLTIESPFNAAIPYNGDITFKYTPNGAVEKTVYFLIDGDNAGTEVTSLTGKQLTKTFSKMSHGVHRLEVYSKATVNDVEITSPSLVYDIICIEDGDQTPIIASVYDVENIDEALFAWGEAGAGEGVIEGGAEGVDVSPRPHVAVRGALFGGTEARAFDDVVGDISVGFAGGAEVDDDGESGTGDEDVVRLDVAVEEVEPVEVVEGIEQAHHEAEEAGLGDGAPHGSVLCCEFIQGDAVDVFDYVVGGSVFFKVGIYLGDAGVVEGGKETDFAQEVVQCPIIAIRTCFGIVQADVEGPFFAVAERVREVFLDNNCAVEHGFLCQVGDTKPAPADASLHTVTMQQGANGQFTRGNGTFGHWRGFLHQFITDIVNLAESDRLHASSGQNVLHEITRRAAEHGRGVRLLITESTRGWGEDRGFGNRGRCAWGDQRLRGHRCAVGHGGIRIGNHACCLF